VTDTTVPLSDESQYLAETVLGVAAIAVSAAVIAVVLVWALLRAARHPAPTSLVVALSLLTLVALIGFVATQAESLVAVASAGIGALAGAVSAQFRQPDK
jgi:uncharacterized membrane protein